MACNCGPAPNINLLKLIKKQSIDELREVALLFANLAVETMDEEMEKRSMIFLPWKNSNLCQMN